MENRFALNIFFKTKEDLEDFKIWCIKNDTNPTAYLKEKAYEAISQFRENS